MRGFVIVLLVASAVGVFVWQSRTRLVQGGDVLSLEILSEPYHWTFMNHPRRVDDERDDWARAAVMWFGPTVVSYLPHMASQLVLPGDRGQVWAHNLSAILVLLLLSALYFAATASGVPQWQAAIVAVLALLNPLLLYLLCFVAVLPAAALLPAALWAYHRRKLVIAGLLLIFAAYSYRAGGLFVLLIFAALLRDEEAYRPFNKMALVVLGLVAGLQVFLQFAFAMTVDVVAHMEVPRMVDAGQGVIGLLSAAGWVLGAWAGRLALLFAWLLSVGGVLLWRPRSWRVLLVLAAFAGWTTVITSVESQVLLFMACAAPLVLAAELARADGWPVQRALGAVAAGTVVVAVTLPVCRAPAPLSGLDPGVEAPDRRITPAAYLYRAATLAPDPHVAAGVELMNSAPPAYTCMIELYLAPLVSADTCHDITPVGKDEPEGPGSRAGFVLVDTDPRSSLLRAQYTDEQQDHYRASLGWLADTRRVGLVAERDGWMLFRRGAGDPPDRDQLERASVDAFGFDGLDSGLALAGD